MRISVQFCQKHSKRKKICTGEFSFTRVLKVDANTRRSLGERTRVFVSGFVSTNQAFQSTRK